MRLIASVFNKGMWAQNMRTTGWIGIVYFLVLFFSVPLQILMMATRDDDYKVHYFENTSSLFSVAQEFQLIIMFTIPVLLAIFLFRYMQVKLSADFMFGLPAKRRTLLHQQLYFGKIVLFVPIVLVTIILYLLSGVLDIGDSVLFDHIFLWGLSTFVISLLVFFATVMVGMFTGLSVLQGVFTYIFFFLPTGITLLFSMNLSYYLDGFSLEHSLNRNIEKLLIFARVADLAHNPLSFKEFFVFIFLIAIFYVVGFITYEKRPVEGATQAITFKFFRPVFWYGVTFCAMLLGGMYFAETQGRDSYGWIIFGYITAAVIGYYVAMMILVKTWRVFHRYKGFVAFAVSMFVIALVVQLDVFGYEKRLPNMEEVKQVYIGGHEYFYAQDYVENSPYNISYYQDKENIRNILALHEAIIANKENSNHRLRTTVVLAYELENGRNFVRQYDVYLPDYEEEYRQHVQSAEYKKNNNLLNTVNKHDILEIVFHNYDGLNKVVHISNENDIHELYDILKAEIDNQTYEETIDHNSWASVEIIVNKKPMHQNVLFKKSYESLETWLAEKQLLEDIIKTSDDVEEIYVMKLNESLTVNDLYHQGVRFDTLKETDDVMKITDDAEIDEILRRSSQYGQGEYAVFIQFQNDSTINIINERNVPAFLEK